MDHNDNDHNDPQQKESVICGRYYCCVTYLVPPVGNILPQRRKRTKNYYVIIVTLSCTHQTRDRYKYIKRQPKKRIDP